MNIQEMLSKALTAQMMSLANPSESLRFKVTVNGAQYELEGERTTMIDLGITSVYLLSKGSTPVDPIPADSAEDLLVEAIRNLIERNEIFYTELRPNWCLPAYLWKLAA